jgi:hypothetical protein
MFKIGDKVSFGVRQYWGGKGRPAIPRYTGTVVSEFTPFAKVPTMWISSPEYSKNHIAFTQRKNGNWVRKGDADDNFHGYSRVSVQYADEAWKPISQNKQQFEEAAE